MSLKLSEIEIGKNIPEMTVRVVSVSPPRLVTTRTGRKTQLTELLVVDEDGATAVMNLWGFGTAEGLRGGQVIRLVDGWAKEWQGKLQLSLGRAGKIEVIADDGHIPPISELSKGRATGFQEE